jgi:carbon starvation protein
MYLSRLFGLQDANVTPAHAQRDDVDFVPGKTSVVLGHHFASIAGAGPIVGPVIAVAFGWIPAVLWILIGGIFFGAVHDLASMTASIRHQGKSIGEIIQRYIGVSGKRLFMIFAFATLILVIAVFIDIVAKTFVSVPSAASSSVLFVLLAVAFGQLMRRQGMPFWLLSAMGVAAMAALIVLGNIVPVSLPYGIWIAILFIYCFIAAIAPVQMLLQPRDYLNSFLLYGMLLFGILGIFISNPRIEMAADVNFVVPNLGTLFPVLFVTVACGAISGFHSLVASGTTSKQLNCETDARRVGFGGMLIESLLAIISVGAVAILTRDSYAAELASAGPVTLFSMGLGGFISSLGVPQQIAVSFVALTVSAFAVTTLDTCTRLARFVVQESLQDRVAATDASEGSTRRAGFPEVISRAAFNRFGATALVVFASVLLLGTGQFQQLWPIFGSANQLLAALALLAVTVWLTRTNVQRMFTMVPMVFMFGVTLSSLAVMAWTRFQMGSYVLMVVALALFVLAIALILLSLKALRRN